MDPAVEREVADAIAQTPDGEFLALDPARAQALVGALAEQLEHAAGLRPALLCSARVRRHVRRLSEQALPALPVFAYQEVPPGLRVETVGVVGAATPELVA
jgi:flagellar biosynthesis protein FlhA